MMNRIVLALNDINEKYICENEPRKCFYKDDGIKKICNIVVFIAAAFILTLSTLLNVFMPVEARRFPLLGNVFSYIQDNLDFAGLYDKYAFKINQEVYDDGLSISLSEVYCDGINLFVSYEVSSDKSFYEYMDKSKIHEGQLNYYGEPKISYYGQEENLNDLGLAGFEGDFIDEYTYVGAKTYTLSGKEFPTQFYFEIKITGVELLAEKKGDENALINGEWIFNVPVTVNKKDIKEYEVNAGNKGHSIDKIVVSPITVSIYSSFEEWADYGMGYTVLAFSDKSEEAIIEAVGTVSGNKSVSQISRRKVGDSVRVYIFNDDVLTRTGKERCEEDYIAENAVVTANIILN